VFPFIIITKFNIVAAVYSGFDTSKEELFSTTDILTIYKEKLSEIVSFENIDFYKVSVDKRLKDVKYTMISYVLEDLIAHPISHRDLKFTLDRFFNSWAEKNNSDLDTVAD